MIIIIFRLTSVFQQIWSDTHCQRPDCHFRLLRCCNSTHQTKDTLQQNSVARGQHPQKVSAYSKTSGRIGLITNFDPLMEVDRQKKLPGDGTQIFLNRPCLKALKQNIHLKQRSYNVDIVLMKVWNLPLIKLGTKLADSSLLWRLPKQPFNMSAI